TKEGYEVLEAADGLQALKVFAEHSADFVVLDIMMPGIDGFEVLAEMRKTSDVPVLLLTAKKLEVDKLKGFDLGADDYVVKPFSPKEVVRRVKAILKRTGKEKNAKGAQRKHVDLLLDTEGKILYKNGKPVDLTGKEYQVMEVFFLNAGRVLTRDQLIEKAFGYDYDAYDRSVDTYIKRIRQKIGDDSKNPNYIQTRYGQGYIFGGKK
ncbi:MAG TPA: DNA-binding response regulator, partial [Eubacteriaceae bacterium]|nr:DNA-binding response regulator [Eubacteriaceae bacterium]